jgi:hypothetical protein
MMAPREVFVVGVLASLDGPKTAAEVAFWIRHPHKVRDHPGPRVTDQNVGVLLDDLAGRGLLSRWAGPPVTFWPKQEAMDAVREADRLERLERHRAFDALHKR